MYKIDRLQYILVTTALVLLDSLTMKLYTDFLLSILKLSMRAFTKTAGMLSPHFFAEVLEAL